MNTVYYKNYYTLQVNYNYHILRAAFECVQKALPYVGILSSILDMLLGKYTQRSLLNLFQDSQI